MPMDCWLSSDEHDFSPPRILGWDHSHSSHLFSRDVPPVSMRAWSTVASLLPDGRTLTQYKRFRTNRGSRISGPGSYGLYSNVRMSSVNPPGGRHSWAEAIPPLQEKEDSCRSSNRWQAEHLKITSKHIPGRVPLPDKGKPVARRGRKATDQSSDLIAGLPEEE